MKVKLITDSASDITLEDEKKYGIDIMPFDITLGDESLRERVDFTAPEFLEMIDKSEFLPKTSQITEIRFEEKFEHYYNEGYDAIIMVLINSTGSKTYENALLARKNLLEEHPEMAKMRIEIIDSHCYSLGYGYPVIEAAKKLIAGQSVDNVVAYLTDMFNNCEIYIIGFNLRQCHNITFQFYTFAYHSMLQHIGNNIRQIFLSNQFLLVTQFDNTFRYLTHGFFI